VSSNPISPDSLRLIAEFGKTTAFKELFDALDAGSVEDWKVAATPEDREKAWHMQEAARLLRFRVHTITKKLTQSES
jgi:hypothetical protein